MAIDNKYGRITTEFGSIGEDEPVVIFRARDVILPEVLAFYHHKCWQVQSPDKHLNLVRNSMDQVIDWQKANPKEVQVPRSADYKPRD
jgi:hypothetical protein